MSHVHLYKNGEIVPVGAYKGSRYCRCCARPHGPLYICPSYRGQLRKVVARLFVKFFNLQ